MFFRFIVISSFLFLTQSFAMETEKPIFMFVGNPGGGKSAVINALEKRKAAEDGVNIGSGLTTIFTPYEHCHKGKQYLLFDTPGLDDIKMRQEAATQIEKALKQEGTYKLFFVITLEAGRVKPADLTTIDIIMDAIKHDAVTFNVIVNKVTRQEKAKLEQLGAHYFLQQLHSAKYKTKSVYYIDKDGSLEDGIKAFFDINPDLEKFIYQDSEAIVIRKSQVNKIEVDQFEKLNKKHEEELNVLKKQLEAANARPPQVIHVYHNEGGGGGGLCVVQ